MSTKSRFTTDKTYHFISFIYSRGERFYSSPLISAPDKDSGEEVEMLIKPLTCESEHDVEIDYSDDKTKGYIFKDEDGNEYHNQYPRASYGQMSNRGDYECLAIVDGELIHYAKAESVYSDIKRSLFKFPNRKIDDYLKSLISEIEKEVGKAGLKFVESEFMIKYKSENGDPVVFSYDLVEA